MRHLATTPIAWTLALGAISAGAGLAAGDGTVPTGVSPGAPDRFARAVGACPTFSWGGAEGASGYELIVYGVGWDGAAEDVRPALEASLPTAAFSWTPEARQCLDPGRYAWSVRGRAGEWSEALLFEVAALPTAAELEQALAVVQAHLAAGGRLPGEGAGSEAGPADRPGPPREPALPAATLEGAPVVAVQGEVSDPTGETYGLRGISHSSDGAGVAAENLDPGGADLLLAGSPPAELTEEGFAREDGGAVGFDFSNPGAGSMALTIDGVDVVTTATDRDSLGGLSCAGGQVAKWDDSAWVCGEDLDSDTTYAAGNQLSLSGTTFHVVEGAASGLDADLLDGLEAAAFAPGLHGHFGQAWSGSSGDPGLSVTNESSGAGLRGTGAGFSGRGVVGNAPAAGGATAGVHGLAASPDGVGGWFRNDGGGDHLVAGDDLASPVFRVTGDGEVVATSYQGDGSQLAGVITGGQSCPPGQVLAGFAPDGSVVCTQLPPVGTLHVVDSAGNVGGDSSIATGADGLPVVSYWDVGNNDLKVAHCDDLFCSSATVQTVDATGDVGRFTSVAIGADGLPIVSYWDATNDDLKVAHCDDTACSSATLQTIDGSAAAGAFTSIAIGSDGLPVISYQDFTGFPTTVLKVAHCDDVFCSSATVRSLDSGDEVGNDTSIAVGSDGLPIVSYLDVGNGDLEVAHCDDLFCSSATLQTVDSLGFVGGFTSLAIGSDGLPVVSYYDFTNDDLRIAHCDDVLCSSAALVTVDAPGSVGEFTSIAIGAEGLPIVSYWDETNDDLKVAHCDDPLCSSATRQVVDGVEASGLQKLSSIAIGANGLPIISYYDLLNGDLKVAHCGNTRCS